MRRVNAVLLRLAIMALAVGVAYLLRTPPPERDKRVMQLMEGAAVLEQPECTELLIKALQVAPPDRDLRDQVADSLSDLWWPVGGQAKADLALQAAQRVQQLGPLGACVDTWADCRDGPRRNR